MSNEKKTNTPAGKKKPKTKKDGSNKVNQYTVHGAQKNLSTNANTTRRQFNRLKYLIQQAKAKKARAALARYNRNRFSLNALPRCSASTQVYGGKSQGDKKWICSSLHQISFNERNFDVRECEVRVYIEGADVTPYIRGNVAWSIQTTGGMNTCTFSLNNNHDAFILTPANVCSKTDLHGWRVPLDSAKRLITGPGRSSVNVDETAKYIIYRNKFERVKPGSKTQQIDESGFWLYPLNPFFCILNKHDAVRVFYRLPHITGYCKIKGKKLGNCIKIKGQEYEEAWAPAFTGFIDEYDYEDDPVGGDRVANVRCYDWRGLFNRMRVRMTIAPTATTAADKVKQKNNAVFDEVRASTGKDKAKAAASGGKTKGRTFGFLEKIVDLGIAKDLVAMFNEKFSTAVQLHCQGKAGSACSTEQFNRIRGTVAAHVGQLEALYLGGTLGTQKAVQPKKLDKNGKPKQQPVAKNLDFTKFRGLKPAIDQIKQHESITVTLSRLGNGTIKANYSSVGASGNSGKVGATEAVQKAAKFLRSTGDVIADYCALYAKATPNWTEKDSNGNVRHTGAQVNLDSPRPKSTVFAFANKNVIALADLDKELKSKHPKIYAGAKLSEQPTVNRVFLLSQYCTNTVVAMFSSVNLKVKKDVDQEIIKSVKRRLFGLADGTFAEKFPVSFAVKGSATRIALALQNYNSSKAAIQGKTAKAYITDTLQKFNDQYNVIKAALKVTAVEEAAMRKKNPNFRTQARIDEMRKKTAARHAVGQKNKVKLSESDAKTLADLVLTDARFDQASAGMYGDLIRAVGQDKHPLAGMSFEMAVEWLTLTHTPISKGLESFVKKYDRGTLQQWNLNMIFGVIGRPLTYREVTAMGKGTLSDIDNKKAPYSPLSSFMHMLLPEKGTGASSIVQQNITHNSFGTQNYAYQTRLALINGICEALDYQFYVSPAGDLVFEFPHYNAMPYDFGRVFQGAYTIVKGLKHFKIASEQGELNTAWVLSGQETDVKLEEAAKGHIKENTFKKIVIVANILARRVGVRVRNLKIELPGVGAALGQGGAKETLMAYGLLEIQRELGRMESATVQHEFRPYMLPNRPIHIVHRQRMALTKTVNYSMAVLGECTTSEDLHYIRGLHQDGSFRHMAGGSRLPVDYSGLYTGDIAQTVRFGSEPQHNTVGTIGGVSDAVHRGVSEAAKQSQSRDLTKSLLEMGVGRKPKNLTNWSCGPYMRDRWLSAGASYTDQMNSAFKRADKFTKWTMGADGISGGYAPTSPSDKSHIAARSYRVSNSAGSPTAASTLENTSLNNATEGGNKSDRPSKTSKDGYFGNLYDPWAFGRRDIGTGANLFGQFGFYRAIYRSGSLSYGHSSSGRQAADASMRALGRRNHRGKIGAWHNGIDFNGNGLLGAVCYTPIPLFNLQLQMGYGWNGYTSGDRYMWTAPSPKGADKHLRFVVRSGGRAIKKPVKNSGGLFIYKIDKSLEKMWRKVKEKYDITPYMSRSLRGNMGMTLVGWGYASMPGATNSKIACELRYVHTGDLVPYPGKSKPYVGAYVRDKGQRAIPADTPVIKVGSSGTNNIHLHFEMQVLRPGADVTGFGVAGGSDETFKEVTKANAEFLRTQIKMRLTGGVAGLKNNTLSSEWSNYFAALNARKPNARKGHTAVSVTTVDQAVDYILARSKQYRDNTGSKAPKVTINPMFFFRPEQIIKVYADRYKKYLASRKESLFNVASGSSVCGPGSAPMKQKIALEYSICLRKAKNKITFVTKRNRSDAKGQCKVNRNHKLSGTKLTARKSSKARHTERVHRKLDAKTKKQTQSGGNASTRNPVTG